MRRLMFVAIGMLLLVACVRQEEKPASILDKGPRYPTDEGVVTDINFERMELDGSRVYRISEAIESFTTRSHDVTPLLSWKNRYVHVGVNDQREAIWVAGIGVVTGDPRVVVYTGAFERVDAKGRAIFRDGTVLQLGEGVQAPSKKTEVVVNIDPSKHAVVMLREQASGKA